MMAEWLKIHKWTNRIVDSVLELWWIVSWVSIENSKKADALKSQYVFTPSRFLVFKYIKIDDLVSIWSSWIIYLETVQLPTASSEQSTLSNEGND